MKKSNVEEANKKQMLTETLKIKMSTFRDLKKGEAKVWENGTK